MKKKFRIRHLAGNGDGTLSEPLNYQHQREEIYPSVAAAVDDFENGEWGEAVEVLVRIPKDSDSADLPGEIQNIHGRIENSMSDDLFGWLDSTRLGPHYFEVVEID